MLSREQIRTLTAVLDVLIPHDRGRGMRGAGEIGVGDHVLGELERSPEQLPLVASGLAALERAGFDELDAEGRADALSELAAAEPAFLPFLFFHTCQGYYQHPAALEALGVPARPPHPLGYEMGPNELELLAPVRAMGPRYREV